MNVKGTFRSRRVATPAQRPLRIVWPPVLAIVSLYLVTMFAAALKVIVLGLALMVLALGTVFVLGIFLIRNWLHERGPRAVRPTFRKRQPEQPTSSLEPAVLPAPPPEVPEITPAKELPASRGPEIDAERRDVSRASENERPSAPPTFGSGSKAGRAAWHLPFTGAHSGLAADGARVGDLEIRAAAVVGPDHRCEEPADPRQDAYALARTDDNRFLLVAVADGVGQSKRSDLGARVAVSAAVRVLKTMLEGGGPRVEDAGQVVDKDRLYTEVAGEMTATARSRRLEPNDVHSILVTAVIPTTPQSDGTRVLWLSWIGDVSAWVHDVNGLTRLTGAEKHGLDGNRLDHVLPFDPGQAQTAGYRVGPDVRIALMTDGLSDALDQVPTARDHFFREWAAPPPHPVNFLHSLCFDAPGQLDDRTAVVVWCGSPSRARRH